MKPRNGKIRRRNGGEKCDQEMKITIKRNENHSFKKWAREIGTTNEKITKRNETKEWKPRNENNSFKKRNLEMKTKKWK